MLFIISSSDADELVEFSDSDDISEMLKWGRFVFLLLRFLYNYIYIDLVDNFLR